MTLPAGGSANFAVQIDFLINNDEVLARVEKETAGIQDNTKKIAIASGILKEEIDKIAPGYIEAKKAAEAVIEQNKTMLLQARNLKAQVREANAELRIMRDNARDIDLLAKPLALGGSLLVGGIFAAASKYVKDSKEATATTIAWKAAEDDAAKSGERIGAVLAEEALPVLKEGTQLLSKFAGFLEANPEVAGFALKSGLVALTLGTIGKAVSSGIRLVADIRQDAVAELQLEAARLQLAASNNQLEAAGIQVEASGGKTLGKASPLAAIGIPALAIAGPVAVLTLLDKGIEAIQKRLEAVNPHLSGFSGSMHLLEQILLPGPAAAAKFIENFHKIPDELNFISEKIKQFTGIDLGKIGGTTSAASAPVATALLGGSQETQDKLVAAYAKYKEEDLALVEKHYSDRNDIITSAFADEQKANADLTTKLGDITSKIGKAEADATANFNKANLEAEQKYQDDRSKILTQSGDDILKIEQDSQARIEKLKQDAADKISDDTQKRDALALIRDKRDLNKGVSEEQANTAKEIKRRQAETAQRLHELDVQYAKEKQKRQEDFNDRIAQLEQQRAEETKAAQLAHDTEIKRIQEQEKEKLAKLDLAFNEERTHRYKAFITQINDLDKYLLGTKSALDASYAANLASLNQFIYNTKQALGTLTGQGATLTGYSTGGGLAAPATNTQTGPTTTQTGGLNQIITSAWQSFLSSIGIHDEGGYMYKGIAKVAWNGVPEFAFSGANTRAAEQIVSGKLTQQNALAAMQRGMQGNVTLNYTGRFDGEVTNAMRRAVKKDIDQSLSTFLAKAAA